MEKEKFELQKRHTENIQELLEDTNMRLNKMEGEYVAQTQSTVRPLSLSLYELSSSPPCPHASPLPECAVQGKCVVELKPLAFLPNTGLHVAVGFPWGSFAVTSFYFFLPHQTFINLSPFFFPLTFSLEITSLPFSFLFYLFVSVFLTEDVIVFSGNV